jgi:hypothetical protein
MASRRHDAAILAWHAMVFALLDRSACPGATFVRVRADDPLARTADDDVRLYALDTSPESAATVVTMPPVDDGCIDASPQFVYPDTLRRLRRVETRRR